MLFLTVNAHVPTQQAIRVAVRRRQEPLTSGDYGLLFDCSIGASNKRAARHHHSARLSAVETPLELIGTEKRMGEIERRVNTVQH